MKNESNTEIKILIIDDCSAPRLVLAEKVRALGYKPILASTGAEGLRLVHEAKPSLVLLDVIMPDLDGFAVTAAIRAQAKLLPIILLTSLDDIEAKRRGQQAGADDFLTKPVQLPDLQVRIAAMLRIKSLNDALTTTNQRLSRLVETLPDGVCVVCDGEVAFASAALVKMLGLSHPLALAHRQLLDFVAEGDRARMAERLGRVAGGDGPPTDEYRFVRGDGENLFVECTGAIIDFDNRPARLEIMRDVTATRQLREQLVLQDRMASLGTLAAGVGHEINNPLSFVLANLDFVMSELGALGQHVGRGFELSEIMEALKECRIGADRVKHIVRDLRTFARGDSENSAVVDVHAVLDWSLQVAGNELRHRAQVVKAYGNVRAVTGSDVRLSQVILNLLMNAAHSIPPGHLQAHQIRVATYEVGARVIIEISDTGSGITAEAQRRLFEPFFTTKPVGEGSGLGLSICYSIVQQLGGEISVQSEVGKGSRFCVSLPIAAATTVPREPAAPEPPPARKGRILVIDDEPLIGNIISRLLPEHHVTTEEHARQAMKRIEAGEQFDALVCDIMMPEMSGVELHNWMRSAAPVLAARTIFITGGAFTDEAALFTRHSAQPVLEKPIDFALLRRLLRDQLESSAAAGVQKTA